MSSLSSSSLYSMHSPSTQSDYSNFTGSISNDIYTGSSINRSIYSNHMMGSNSYGPTYPLPSPFRMDLNDDPYSSSTTNIHYATNGNDVVTTGSTSGLVPIGIGNGNGISSIHHYTDNLNLSSSMAQHNNSSHNNVSMHHSLHHHQHQTYPHDHRLDSLGHSHQSSSSSHQDIYANSCIRNIQPYPLVSNSLTTMTNNDNRHQTTTTIATTKHPTSSGIDYWQCDSQPLPPPPSSSSSSLPTLPPPQSPHHCYPTNVINNKITTNNSNHWSRSSPSNNSTPSPIQPITSTSSSICPPPLPPQSSSMPSHAFHSSPHQHNIIPSSDSSSSSSSSTSVKQFSNPSSSGHLLQQHQQQQQSQQGSMMMINNNNSGITNPLQSLQKMVQIDSSTSSPSALSQPSNGNDHLRTIHHQQQYETASVPMTTTQQQQQLGVCPSSSSLDDQNSMSETQVHPQSSYKRTNSNNSSISASSSMMMMGKEFSPSAKNLSSSSSTSNSPPPLIVEVNNNKHSNKRNGNQISRKNKNVSLASNILEDCGSPICNQKLADKTTTNIGGPSEVILQTDQTHDHSNHSYRCGSIETTSSRDSIKSNDSINTTTDGQSSSVYGGMSMSSSQCSTPNNWKLNNNTCSSNNQQKQQIEFRNFSNSNSIQTPKSSWWSENPSSTSSNRSFTPMLADGNQSSYNNNNNYQMTRSTSSSQSWSKQQQTISGHHHHHHQMLPFQMSGCIPDGIIKKKRGRPFGSKNRRSLEHAAAVATVSTLNPKIVTVDTAVTTNASNQLIDSNRTKKRKSSMLIDIGINTNLSFDVHDDWDHHNNNDKKNDQFDFESNVQHPLPLASKRKKIVGPVIRIDKSDNKTNNSHEIDSSRYSIVNNSLKSINNDSEQKSKKSSSIWLSSLNRRKNLQINNQNHNDQKWYCILCQKPPNYKGLGELYGPYYIQMDQKSRRLFSDLNGHSDKNDNNNNDKHHERRSLRKRTVEQLNNNDEMGNIKGNINEMTGQSIINNKIDQPMEVWIHEDCIVWSSSVYVEGMKIRNLEPAIIESFDNICTKCKLPGATLGCIFKNCQMSPLHYLCAKEKDCDLDEEKFILSCSKHKKRRIIDKDSEPNDNQQRSTIINQAQEDGDNKNNADNNDGDNNRHH
uniref:PHD-type domain-containing protein n=1 Tax=Dermatophagoides pteronyssinus TaxID=6956 RepID=A0A6P6YD90_DERPT|nr:putative uncharacterized protein DDB_G0277255 isoform X2 [Dermatophagoides pteronyssinus]